jgi:hypothetical protein
MLEAKRIAEQLLAAVRELVEEIKMLRLDLLQAERAIAETPRSNTQLREKLRTRKTTTGGE